ncbi:hypothetical protein V5N11_018378 [Cardamine amara subsp. amara]|uniref:Uncharacterized protein n=1 Tax=Cardamine amara subsp. amara TaxID=228776 RepID=A0ABD1BN90_CARAN
MQRCLVLHDVSTQPQHSSRQRREEIMNERRRDDASHGYSDIDGGEVPQTQVHDEAQEDEEVYHVNHDDDAQPSNAFSRDTFRVPVGRGEQRSIQNSQSSVMRGSGSHRSGGSSGGRRRQSFETTLQDTITGYREFQRQSLQQLCPGSFDQEDYDEFKKAEVIFLELELPKNTRFYWACIDSLKELKFWRKYFIDITGGNDKDKIQLLEAMTSISRNDQDLPKRLSSSHLYGSQHFGSHGFQQWGSPPTAPHWGTPPTPGKWGTPPTAGQWGTPPTAGQWGTSPNASQWGLPPNVQQCGLSGTTTTNVQYGFSVGGHEGSMKNTEQEVSCNTIFQSPI